MVRKMVQQNRLLLVAFFLSLLITGFGLPSDCPFLSLLAATFGYALFWYPLQQQKFSRNQMLLWIWALYFISSLIQTRWLLTHPFFYIIGIWLFLNGVLSLPYAFITSLWLRSSSLLSLVAFSSGFALLDMLEQHLFLLGITFRTIGAFWMATPWTSMLITLFGGGGLTFLVVFMNGLVTYSMKKKREAISYSCLFFLLSLLVISSLLFYFSPTSKASSPSKIALLHQATLAINEPTPRDLYELYLNEMNKLFNLLPTLKKERVNLIILPEGAFPYSHDTSFLMKRMLPSRLQPYLKGKDEEVTTEEIMSAIAQYTGAFLLLGIERREQLSLEDESKTRFYNSSFLFSPNGSVSFYDKRVLVPGGEYIPLEEAFLPILHYYGITGSFQEGKEARVLSTDTIRLFPLICYEETLTQYVSPVHRLHPTLVVSMSNDHWFPSYFFANEHWLLGKMRAMEEGLMLVRCSNLGVSGIILPNGKEVIKSRSPFEEELLLCNVYPESQKTLYSYLGEPIVSLLFALLLLGSFLTHCLRRAR